MLNHQFCNWAKTGKNYRCMRCGKVKSKQTIRECGKVRHKEVVQKKYLGDRTEDLLKKIGITPDRYKEAKQALGLPPTCNCASRKAWMNKAHAWLRGETIEPLIDEPR